MRFRHPEAAKLVESDSVDVLRMLADIRLEPMPVALMLHLGGPKCRRLLLRPETYEGSGLGLGSLATYAILAMYTDDADDAQARLDGFFRICLALTSDFACLAMTDALGPSNAPDAATRASALLNHPRYAEWKAKYGVAFRKHITL